MSLASTTDPNLTPPDRVASVPKAVTALFDTREHAEKACVDLIHAGVPPQDVSILGGGTPLQQEPADEEQHGFWHQLKHLFMPEEDRAAYAEGLRRGGYTVAVRTDAAAFAAVIDILDRDGAVNMDEREADWRREGWTSARDGAAELGYRPAEDATAGFAASEAALWPTETDSSAAGAGAAETDSPAAGAGAAETDSPAAGARSAETSRPAAGFTPAASLPDADAAAALVARSAAELVAADTASRAPPVPSPGAVDDLIAPASTGAIPERISPAAAEMPLAAAEMPLAPLVGSKPHWPSLAPRPRRDQAQSRPRVRSFVADSDPGGEA